MTREELVMLLNRIVARIVEEGERTGDMPRVGTRRALRVIAEERRVAGV